MLVIGTLYKIFGGASFHSQSENGKNCDPSLKTGKENSEEKDSNSLR